jgi:hypothetical protein
VPVDRRLHLPTQDRELVAKDQDLQPGDIFRAMVWDDEGEELTEHQVEE